MLFIQHPNDHGFAMDTGQDRNPKIDGPLFHVKFETAVLGNAPFGDIQFGHDFEPGNQGIVHGRRQGVHGLIQDAVDSKFHLDASFPRFNVNVTRMFLERA